MRQCENATSARAPAYFVFIPAKKMHPVFTHKEIQTKTSEQDLPRVPVSAENMHDY
jgi:hypothetical protein